MKEEFKMFSIISFGMTMILFMIGVFAPFLPKIGALMLYSLVLFTLCAIGYIISLAIEKNKEIDKSIKEYLDDNEDNHYYPDRD